MHSCRMFHTAGAALNSRRKDYYKTLKVAKAASAKDIKKAYYKLAKKYHPDTNIGDSNMKKKFQDVSEAYEVLSDDSKRKQYDAFGTSDRWANPSAGAGVNDHWSKECRPAFPEGRLSNILLLLLMLTTTYWYWLKNPLFKLRLTAGVSPFE